MPGKKILIVEDEKILADVLEAKLRKEGYEVSVAYDGEDGYNKINEKKPDLILLDIVLPKMTGYDILEKLSTDGNRTPVIIISNSGQPVELEKTTRLGAVDHLIKTQFDPLEVVMKVKNYLNGKKKEVSDEAGADFCSTEVDSSKIKILLVEDDKFLRDLCTRKLKKEGFVVFEALDGEQALKELEKKCPTIVLLDIILPSMDGFEVLTKIRANANKKIAQTPVIMLSNLGQEDDVKRAMEMGASNYLIKANFTTQEIVGKVKEVLKSLEK